MKPVQSICEGVKTVKRGPHETQQIFVHTDAAQAIGKIPVYVDALAVDYLTIVGHKVKNYSALFQCFLACLFLEKSQGSVIIVCIVGVVIVV